MNRFKKDSFWTIHNSFVFFNDQLFDAFAFKFGIVVFFLLKLFLDVSDQKIFAEPWMKKVFLSFRVHYLIVACHSILMVSEKQIA